MILGSFYLLILFCSLGCTIITFMASYENYPSGHALKELHQIGEFFLSLYLIGIHIHTFLYICLIYHLCIPSDGSLWFICYQKEDMEYSIYFGYKGYVVKDDNIFCVCLCMIPSISLCMVMGLVEEVGSLFSYVYFSNFVQFRLADYKVTYPCLMTAQNSLTPPPPPIFSLHV